MNHLHKHDPFPREKKVNLIGSWSVEKFSNFPRNRKKKPRADPIWRMVKAARGLWRGKKGKETEKSPLQIQIGPALGPNVLAAPFAYSLASPLLRAYLFPFFFKISIFWRKILFQDSFKGIVFPMGMYSNGKSHRGDLSFNLHISTFFFDINWRLSGHKFKLEGRRTRNLMHLHKSFEPTPPADGSINRQIRRHTHTHSHTWHSQLRLHRSLLAATN